MFKLLIILITATTIRSRPLRGISQPDEYIQKVYDHGNKNHIPLRVEDRVLESSNDLKPRFIQYCSLSFMSQNIVADQRISQTDVVAFIQQLCTQSGTCPDSKLTYSKLNIKIQLSFIWSLCPKNVTTGVSDSSCISKLYEQQDFGYNLADKNQTTIDSYLTSFCDDLYNYTASYRTENSLVMPSLLPTYSPTRSPTTKPSSRPSLLPTHVPNGPMKADGTERTTVGSDIYLKRGLSASLAVLGALTLLFVFARRRHKIDDSKLRSNVKDIASEDVYESSISSKRTMSDISMALESEDFTQHDNISSNDPPSPLHYYADLYPDLTNLSTDGEDKSSKKSPSISIPILSTQRGSPRRYYMKQMNPSYSSDTAGVRSIHGQSSHNIENNLFSSDDSFSSASRKLARLNLSDHNSLASDDSVVQIFRDGVDNTVDDSYWASVDHYLNKQIEDSLQILRPELRRSPLVLQEPSLSNVSIDSDLVREDENHTKADKSPVATDEIFQIFQDGLEHVIAHNNWLSVESYLDKEINDKIQDLEQESGVGSAFDDESDSFSVSSMFATEVDNSPNTPESVTDEVMDQLEKFIEPDDWPGIVSGAGSFQSDDGDEPINI